MSLTRDERLLIVQRTYDNWNAIYDDRDDVEANDAYMAMYEKAVAKFERAEKNSSPKD